MKGASPQKSMARTRYKAGRGMIPLKDLPAAALRAVIREGYGATSLKADVLAGLVVGIVALPLAMALAIAVGVPPQHGLYTAIVAGFFVAALGGSRTQVTGPTAAFIVILAPIFSKFGMAGLLLSGLMAGVMLIAMGLARMGRLIEFIPHPVTSGFTAGIGTVIATLQLKDLLGLKCRGQSRALLRKGRCHVLRARDHFGLGDRPRVGDPCRSYLPASRHAPSSGAVGDAASRGARGFRDQSCDPRRSRSQPSRADFTRRSTGDLVAGIPQLPPLPVLPWRTAGPGWGGFPAQLRRAARRSYQARSLLPCWAQSSRCSRRSLPTAWRGRKHDPDAELLALGVSNLLAPFFGGIPATGAIARTATNIRRGARSPFAAMTHALAVLVAVLALAPLLGYLPMTSLAALLLLVAWNMSEIKHFVHIVARRAEERRRRAADLLRADRGLRHGRRRLRRDGAGGIPVHAPHGRRDQKPASSETVTLICQERFLPGVAVYEISGPCSSAPRRRRWPRSRSSPARRRP